MKAKYSVLVSAISLLAGGVAWAQQNPPPMAPAERTSPTTDPDDRSDPSYPIVHSATNSGAEMDDATMKAMTGQDKFVHKAAVSGLTEVAASKAAAQKSTNADVKKLAAQMVKDHEAANKELKSIAQSKGVKVPTAPDAKHQGKLDDLSKLSGAAFDKAYVAQMTTDHEKAIALFTDAASDKSLDPALMAFAKKTLPTLKMHREHVKEVQAKVGA